MRAIKCKIIFNTRWGYVMSPIMCNSINEALKLAREAEMAYQIFDMNGNFIKSGWF